MLILKNIWNFFFGPKIRPDPIQRDIGRIIATVTFRSGETFVKEFVGINNGFQEMDDCWYPSTVTALVVYNEWRDNTKFITIDSVDIPVSEIISIRREYFETIVTVN